MKHQIKLFVIFLALNVVVNALLLRFFYRPKRIAILDMQNIVNGYVQSMGDRDYDEKKAEKFIAKMQGLVGKVAKDNRLIIVPRQVIFSGEDMDITEQFREALKNAK
jgi:hypothetical protein